MAVIGYNISKAEELMENIKDNFEKMGIYTQEQWKEICTNLQKEWRGEDEQDFERTLGERLLKLYDNAYNLAQNSIDTIDGLVTSWTDFQQKNTISGEKARANNSGMGSNKLTSDKPKIKKIDLLKPTENFKPLSGNQNMGLLNANSDTKIKSYISDFVKNIKTKTKNLFDTIDTTNAFFGGQNKSIKNYIDKVASSVAEVTVAIKDIDTALDKLVKSNYTTANSDVSTQFKNAQSTVDKSLSDLGTTRWS